MLKSVSNVARKNVAIRFPGEGMGLIKSFLDLSTIGFGFKRIHEKKKSYINTSKSSKTIHKEGKKPLNPGQLIF